MSRARRLAANLVSVNRTNLSEPEKGASYPGLEIIAQSLCWRSPTGVSGSSEHC